MSRSSGCLGVIFAAALLGCGGPATPSAAEPSTAEPAWIETFDQVWQTVRERHWDPELGGVDWEGVRAELRPRLRRARSLDEVRSILQEMLARLDQSHFAILPGHVAADDESSSGGPGGVGIELRMLDGAPVVFRVEEGSSAAEQKVSPGWAIARVDGQDAAHLVKEVASGARAESATLLTRQVGAVQLALRGELDSRVAVTFDTPDGERELSLERRPTEGTPFRFGHLPAMLLRYHSRIISEGDATIGYIRLSAFFDPAAVVPRFARELEALEESGGDGVIIDLRGNPGGIGAMAMGMSGYLVEESGHILGTMKTREGDLRFVINPQPVTFSGKVAILIDEMSMSTSEIFAAGLRDIGRARIFGTRSGGAALPSVVEKLPTGDSFQFAVADYVSSSGERLEGVGLVPDEKTPLTREDLLAGRDTALEAARAWIAAPDGQKRLNSADRPR